MSLYLIVFRAQLLTIFPQNREVTKAKKRYEVGLEKLEAAQSEVRNIPLMNSLVFIVYFLPHVACLSFLLLFLCEHDTSFFDPFVRNM